MDNRCHAIFAFLLLLSALLGAPLSQALAADSESLAAQASMAVGTAAQSLSVRDYTFGYWLNGMRKHFDDSSPDVLCLESGYYGFSLDLADFSQARFGSYDRVLNYTEALQVGGARVEQLSPVELAIELESEGTVYRAVGCRAGRREFRNGRHLEDAWLWESGQWAQHYELLGLKFEDSSGRQLAVNGSLSLVAWPQSLSLTADIAPSHMYQDGLHDGVVHNGHCVLDTSWKVAHDARLESPEWTVECWIKVPQALRSFEKGVLLAKNGNGARGHYRFEMQHGLVSAVMNRGLGAKTGISITQRAGAFQTNAWNHLALSYDGVSMRFYINGHLQGSKVQQCSGRSARGPLRLGQRADGKGAVTAAVYDQLRVWHRALSAAEIKAHAKQPQQLANRRGLQYEENFDAAGAHAVQVPALKDVSLRVRLQNAEHSWQSEKKLAGVWPLGDAQQISLNCNLHADSIEHSALSIQVNTAKQGRYPVRYDAAYNCYVAEIHKVKRGWRGGYRDIRNYDDFDLIVENRGSTTVHVPFLLDLRNPAQITGLCPILCDGAGVPTGIPVQLSKNWHEAQLGAYFRGYTQLPAAPGRSTYKLRLVYGFYGTLPSASHAQLSLVGYGGSGRWDQLAIGCWGETMCFDMDMSCTDVAITDVRMLMARNGRQGKKWAWTDAGWGGDWLCVKDAKQRKHYFSEMKTAYLAHGPCLTEVRYDGNYGSQREVGVQANVQTLRTDDFARTLQTFTYTFTRQMSAEDGWLFKMGRTRNSVSPQVAYGNAAGPLCAERLPATLQPGDLYLDRVRLGGEPPWWVGFPGGYLNQDRDWGTGSRAWIIRSYRAQLGGREYTNPSISMPVRQVDGEGRANLDLLLTPPSGVTHFLPGDTIEIEVEWMTFHREADDYYGPNASYRQHLTEHPRSWRTIYREALGNDLKINVVGGALQHRYPIVIQVDWPQVLVQIEGGCGCVPIRFEGLKSASGYKLYQMVDGHAQVFDQSRHGNDFWQTDFDLESNSYSITYNLPLDAGGASEWLFSAE
jgi:hypothetical protein